VSPNVATSKPHGALPDSATGLAWLAIVAAVATMGLKFGAYALTGSVGLLSDAVESSANLVAALTALFALWYAARPEDRSHNYGHGKIEFFAAGVEGALVLVAAGWILWSAVDRLAEPRPLEAFGFGLAASLAATAINFAVARVLLRVALVRRSPVLEADGRHLMTDVWTSIGVVVGLALVWVTGEERLDPLIALLVGLGIARTGFSLLRSAFDGLMDRALPPTAEATVRRAIAAELAPGETFHAVRTRQSGGRRFVDFHLLVPGDVSVRRAHERSGRIEAAVARALPGVETTVHVEPVEERAAWEDSPLLPLEEPAESGPPVGRRHQSARAGAGGLGADRRLVGYPSGGSQTT
jgi:cation diffusion facilitator family transporter